MPLFSRHTDAPPRGGSPDVAAPSAGTAAALLRRYRPLETRASGGFGSVEVCLDTKLQRRVAIKRMPLASRYSTTPAETRATALAEARTASMLQHPNIVSVIDFTYDESFAYLVMEYVDGMSLEEFLEQVDGSSLTYDEAACIADALVQALSFAHENGVLHLDIKPGNVLIDRSGHVKLTDFGMATLTHAAGFGGARGGTIGYMPPEQLDGSSVDERTDLFALAAVLYESLCGTAPFRAGTPQDSLKRIKKGVILPSALLPDIPELSESALLEALAYDPADRMDDVGEFGDMFLAQLGRVREGRRSLARMIEELTADDVPDEDEPGRSASGVVWELDPAEGYLGSRSPKARRAAVAALSGVSCAVASAQILAMLPLPNLLSELVCAAAIGCAAAVAPQLGSALLAIGFLVAIMSSTGIVSVLPVAALAAAVLAGWWCAWGREGGAASAVLAALVAAGALGGGTLVPIGPVAAVAGYALGPVTAGATVAVGTLFSRLVVAEAANGGELGGGAAAGALADPGYLMGCALAALAAAATSLLLARLWRNMRDSRGRALLVPACAVPGFMVVLLLSVANPVKISSSEAYPFALALAIGALSSIIVFICTYLLGYRKELSEGDRT